MNSSMKKYFFQSIALAILTFNGASVCYAGIEDIQVKINWTYSNFSPEIFLYDIKHPKPVRLWKTESVKNINDIPSKSKISDSIVRVKKGERKKFLLVATNTSDKPVYFFAAPHVVEPAEYSLGFKFKCLCINHAFSIGPKETWYRVVELRVSKDVVGDNLNITHTIVGIDKDKMKQFEIKKAKPHY